MFNGGAVRLLPLEGTEWPGGRPRRRFRGLSSRAFFEEDAVPDLRSQLEAVLDAVWASEANWRFDDRLDLAERLRPAARRPAPRPAR